MTMNGVMAIILRYFSESGSFRASYVKSGWLAINSWEMSKYTN